MVLTQWCVEWPNPTVRCQYWHRFEGETAKCTNQWQRSNRICVGIIHNTSKNDSKTKISTVLDRNIKRGRSQSNDKTICVKLVKLKNNWDGEKMKMTMLKSNSLHKHRKLVFGQLRSPWMCVRFTVYDFDKNPNLNTREAAVLDCASTIIVLHKVWWACFKRLTITRADAKRQTVHTTTKNTAGWWLQVRCWIPLVAAAVDLDKV